MHSLFPSLFWRHPLSFARFILHNLFVVLIRIAICRIEEYLAILFPSDVDILWALALTAVVSVGVWALTVLFLMVMLVNAAYFATCYVLQFLKLC